jgi:hypothetical protein
LYPLSSIARGIGNTEATALDSDNRAPRRTVASRSGGHAGDLVLMN